MVTNTSFTFVIDTNAYSGNFCREMCAYISGIVGDCGVGQEEQSKFLEEMELTEDDTGPFREIVQPKDESGEAFTQDLIGMEPDEYGVRRPCKEMPNPNWKSDDRGKYKHVDECADDPKFSHPAFLSVGIIMNHEPKESQIKILKERSHKFAENGKLKIEGFRLVTVLTLEVSKSI